MANVKTENPFLTRFSPDCRFTGRKEQIKITLEKPSAPSITDKEAYRLTLASLRGNLAQGSGSPNVGSYSIPAGKEYDEKFDFSYLNRPDITIVMLDEYIKHFEERLKNSDESLAEQIKLELAKAEEKRSELVKQAESKDSKTE